MPSRAYLARKKQCPEVQYDELHQAFLSTHSTTSNTATTTSVVLPVRSIRSRHAVAEATISCTHAFSSNKNRGVIIGKKTAAIVLTSEKSRVTCDLAISGRPKESYDIDLVDKVLVTWIQKKAANHFKDWKYKIHKNQQTQGDAPISVEFIHCPYQWEWLCNHFKAEDFNAVQSAKTAEVEKMMAYLPLIDEASDGTMLTSAPSPVLSYETQTDSGKSTELEAEVAQLRAHQAAIEEQLQRKRADHFGELVVNAEEEIWKGILGGKMELRVAIETAFRYRIFNRKTTHHPFMFEGYLTAGSNVTISGGNIELHRRY
ncbi:hypothetical protein LguiB_012737 [Lonicera macranthoides]